MNFTRREFSQLALTALPAATGLSLPVAKPNSKFGGVQIGIIAPYSFRSMPTSADDLLKYLLTLGINSVEMQSEPVEAFAGAPIQQGRGPMGPPPGGTPGGAPGGGQMRPPGAGGPPAPGPAPGAGGPPRMSPEQQAAMRARAEDLKKWRLSASMDKYKEFRKKYDDAGVTIPIIKFGLNSNMSPEEIEYCFTVAKVMGCRAITCEPPLSQTKLLGEFAAKHKIMLGYHGHSNMTSEEAFAKPSSWETAMAHSEYNGCNIDVGHFTAGNGFSPAEFIKKYNKRITNLHLKDRKINQGPNMPWGQGDTQIKEILLMMKKEKYTFPASIELEYPVPEGSDAVKEVAKCIEFCKNALA
ncbi:MAG: sugar phosphate isomerase/epimerase [Acidobacteria bacterium]|nr:sugar phosphate isomerase/epimerase [Acidobacteriota bacterium]